jgi:hypothetical protein
MSVPPWSEPDGTRPPGILSEGTTTDGGSR